MNHTPGPWPLATVKTSVGLCHRIGDFPSTSHIPGRERTYGCVYEDGTSKWRLHDNGSFDSELLANARLMAAAPDMLEALKRSLDWLSSYPGGCALAVYEDARVAIAKAEGRQP